MHRGGGKFGVPERWTWVGFPERGYFGPGRALGVGVGCVLAGGPLRRERSGWTAFLVPSLRDSGKLSVPGPGSVILWNN
jgi:hypothetical protein